MQQLKRIESDAHSDALEHTLLTVTIDFLAGVRRKEGEATADGLLATLASSIQKCAGDNASSAYAADGVFQIILPGRNPAAARTIAEHLAQAFRDSQSDRDSGNRLSLSIAIVPWKNGARPELLLQQGQETVAIAKQSGGDITIEHNTFAAELSSWQNELNVGSPFANVVAQDIMEPFPAVLERDPLNHAMLAALRRNGAPIWPFVNREGRLVGVAAPSSIDAAVDGDQQSEEGLTDRDENLTLTNPVTIAHNATFPEIYEAFSTQGCLEMVVVADQRPVGFITFSGFVSLIEPIDSATFARHEADVDDSRSLLVGPLVNGSERAWDSEPEHVH